MRVFSIDTALIFKSRKYHSLLSLHCVFLTSVELPYATTSRKPPTPTKGHLSKVRISKRLLPLCILGGLLGKVQLYFMSTISD